MITLVSDVIPKIQHAEQGGCSEQLTRPAYLEVFQVLRHSIRAHFVPFDDVSSVLCVTTHRTGTVSLVEALGDILGGELQVSVLSNH